MNLNDRAQTFRRFAMLGVVALLACWVPAQADILISPQRVILSDKSRQAVISLHNPGTTGRTYRLEWVERRLTESGELIMLKEGENPRSIARMVRFSPRRIAVPPGQTQTVRLDYRPPAGLAPGEYRAHLRIGLEPPPGGGGGTEVMRGEKDGMSFHIDALLSFAVPVFVRQGEGSAEARIAAVEPATYQRDGKPEAALKVTLARSGEFSSYGRLAIYQQLQAGGPVAEISETGGVAMYAEVSGQQRIVSLRPGTTLAPGSWIRVTYEGEGAERGRIFAEKVFRIAN